MKLAFKPEEYATRQNALLKQMTEEKLDAILLFAPKSMFWLTGYETFDFCFFQCLIVKSDGTKVLLARLPDLQQAQLTSTIDDIVLWHEHAQANPAFDLRNLLNDLGLLGCSIGVEYRTHGLTAAHGRLLDEQLKSFGTIVDVSKLIDHLRLIKSPSEIAYLKKAADLSDQALDAALKLIQPSAHEADIIAAMMQANFAGDGDFPANNYVIGSGDNALLCRYKSGRRVLSQNDQLTLEWSGVYRHYHAPMMRTIIVGKPHKRHEKLYSAAYQALTAIENAMKPGHSFSAPFDANMRVMESHDLTRHRFDSCGYSLGAHFSPSWIEKQQFQAGNDLKIDVNMALFAHVMLFDSDTMTAMTLAQSYIITPQGPKVLSRHDLDMLIVG